MPPRRKRTLTEAMDENGGDLYSKYSDRLENTPIDMNADQIRRKIRSFLDSGVMGVGEFQAAIQVIPRAGIHS